MMRFPRRSESFLILFACLVTATSACGKVKSADDRVLVVKGASQEGAGSAGHDAFDELRDLFKLYGDGGGMGRSGFQNFFDRFRDRIEPVLAGAGISFNDLVQILFQWDKNGDDLLNPEEVVGGVEKKTQILKWFHGDETRDEAELLAFMEQDFPVSSKAARTAFATQLMRFDRAWAGGDADGKLSRKEVSLAALLYAGVSSTDFTPEKFFQGKTPTPTEKALASQLLMKFRQRLQGRYPSNDPKTLNAEDTSLEWTVLALDLLLADRRTRLTGDAGNGGLAEEDQEAALSDLGFPSGLSSFMRIRDYYDSPLSGGNGDKRLNSIEVFQITSDMEFAKRFLPPGKKKVGGKALRSLFPLIGKSFFSSEYLSDQLPLFDENSRGGNGNGTLEAHELVPALAEAKTVEGLFAGFDKNSDGLLSKPEVRAILISIAPDLNDDQVIDAFFADVGLDGTGWGLWNWLGMQVSSEDTLDPAAFYVRFRKILPRLMNVKPTPKA